MYSNGSDYLKKKKKRVMEVHIFYRRSCGRCEIDYKEHKNLKSSTIDIAKHEKH